MSRFSVIVVHGYARGVADLLQVEALEEGGIGDHIGKELGGVGGGTGRIASLSGSRTGVGALHRNPL